MGERKQPNPPPSSPKYRGVPQVKPAPPPPPPPKLPSLGLYEATMMRVVSHYNGHTVGGRAAGETALFLNAMREMSREERVAAFDMLSDHFCRRCGRSQPKGDCQC